MEEKKLTDEEIVVKALELAIKWCKESGFDHADNFPLDEIKRTLDLIHRLQDENERLTEEKDKYKGLYETMYRKYSDLQDKEFNCEALRKQRDEYLDKALELQKQVDELTEELKNLDWYKMWHKKFKKEIDDLTLELETYRPTKLSGNGQCKCSNCGTVHWTDWCSRYKGQTLCDRCLKEIISTEEKQAVKDTAKEILQELYEYPHEYHERKILEIAKRKGVEVE